MTTTTERTTTHYYNGYTAGLASGSWYVDGNTDAYTAQRILDLIEEGDPGIMDAMPSPLSGEWAGESMTELLGDDYTDDDADAYEAGFVEGWVAEIVRSATIIATPES